MQYKKNHTNNQLLLPFSWSKSKQYDVDTDRGDATSSLISASSFNLNGLFSKPPTKLFSFIDFGDSPLLGGVSRRFFLDFVFVARVYRFTIAYLISE